MLKTFNCLRLQFLAFGGTDDNDLDDDNGNDANDDNVDPDFGVSNNDDNGNEVSDNAVGGDDDNLNSKSSTRKVEHIKPLKELLNYLTKTNDKLNDIYVGNLGELIENFFIVFRGNMVDDPFVTFKKFISFTQEE